MKKIYTSTIYTFGVFIAPIRRDNMDPCLAFYIKLLPQANCLFGIAQLSLK